MVHSFDVFLIYHFSLFFMPYILVTICARGGSKGIPGKNIKKIAGKPLLAYTADIARSFAKKVNADLVLSTDSEEIIRIGKECGIPVTYLRPAELANDICSKCDAIKDVMLWMENSLGKKYDFVVDLDITSPIRSMNDIEKCLEMAEKEKDLLTLFSVSPCGRNPYFNMVEQKSDGFYGVVKDAGDITSRQTSPKVYDINGSIYVYRREALDREKPRAITDRTKVFVMDHICFDLDEPEDYDYMEYLMSKGKLKDFMR